MPASARTGRTARSVAWPAASSRRPTRAPACDTCWPSATTWRWTSDGAFDARRAGPGGHLDPSGYVKGWAVEEAAWLLDAAGARDYLLNAGGDVIARGEASPGRPWRIGIRHPDQVDRLAAVLEVRDRAVATSGTYERGEHLVDPRTGLPARGLRSLTVVGPRLGFVDAYATAAFVMGLSGLGWVASHADHEALAITDDGRVVWTDGFGRYLASTTGRPSPCPDHRRPGGAR